MNSEQNSNKWKFFRVSQASSKTLRQFLIPCIEATFTMALVRLLRDVGLGKWECPLLSSGGVSAGINERKAVNRKRVGKKCCGDLDNEDNAFIATKTSIPSFGVSVRQCSKASRLGNKSIVTDRDSNPPVEGTGVGGTCYSGVKKNAMHGDLDNEDVCENKKCVAEIPINDEGAAIGCHFSEERKFPRGLSQGKVSKVSKVSV
jgi:hypothetical protein